MSANTSLGFSTESAIKGTGTRQSLGKQEVGAAYPWELAQKEKNVLCSDPFEEKSSNGSFKSGMSTKGIAMHEKLGWYFATTFWLWYETERRFWRPNSAICIPNSVLKQLY